MIPAYSIASRRCSLPTVRETSCRLSGSRRSGSPKTGIPKSPSASPSRCRCSRSKGTPALAWPQLRPGSYHSDGRRSRTCWKPVSWACLRPGCAWYFAADPSCHTCRHMPPYAHPLRLRHTSSFQAPSGSPRSHMMLPDFDDLIVIKRFIPDRVVFERNASL
jgi:hypothetical protein